MANSLKLAAQGDADSQWFVGSSYQQGEWVPKDESEAVKWFRRAAEQGHALAQYSLGACYDSGRGVPEDCSEAVKWFRKAAEQGHALAQNQLGYRYAFGRGVLKDESEAVKWFRKAAEQGDAFAQTRLGFRYAIGQGVLKDESEAVKWFRKAAEQGHAEAQNQLGLRYAIGRGVPEDRSEAVKWFRQAAEQGDAFGQLNLSLMYRSGNGVPVNHIMAYSWASLAAAGGNDDARKERDSLATEMTREQVAEAQKTAAQFQPRIVREDTKKQQQGRGVPTSNATGSGFFLTADGYFVTNQHVIADAIQILVRTPEGTFPAVLVRSDATNDVAILKVARDQGKFAVLPVRGSRGLRPGDHVATVGYPNPELQGEAAKYSGGEVAALSGPRNDPRFLQVSVPIQPGNSGGPLVDSAGRVVGVVVAQLDKIAALKLTGTLPENVNYAVKGTILLGVLEAVPGLADAVQSEPSRPPRDAADMAKAVASACGMVLVER